MSMDARYRYSQSYAANASIQVPPPTMTSQRFCLRWNNHQSNLLSVFDQLLHDESFVDVTIGVEGQYLKAHKMVLSACSPYFQALFVSTPDKHPIVILKDVPYADMRSLLDFMYRGEVSVDQDRLTAFLRVAENLRIKGLTEVNEDKCDIPSITSSLLSGNGGNNNNNVQNTMSHSSHRMPPAPPRRPAGQLMSPLLGNALAQPKRKRGRPRKLSGSSNGAPSLDAEGSPIVRGSPEMLEVKMNMDGFQGSESDIKRDTDVEGDDGNEIDDKSDIQKENQEQPVAGTSREQEGYHNNEFHADSPNDQKLITPKMEATHHTPQTLLTQPHRIPMAMDGVSNYQTTVSGQSLSTVHTSTSDNINNNNPNLTTSVASTSNAPTSGRQPIRRRARRRATSASQDPAEQLTEMSVRGLNLFRYASVNEGIYQCTECAKVDVQKTFKNKYSFQRHAFLYHEGHQRKVFPCPVCGKEFSRPDKMKNHMKTVHDCFMPKDCVFPVNFFVNP